MSAYKLNLKSEDKLRLESDFNHMRTNGTKSVGKLMLMVMAPAPDNLLRFGVVCGKKFHKRAVRRNRARRLIWESVRRIKPQISSTENHLLFIPRPAILKCKQGDVQAELVKLLSRNKLFAETQNPGLHHPEC